MTKSLMGRWVPDEMFSKANGTFARGGKAFVCLPEGGGLGNCGNCEGCGHLILQRVVGGPYDTPPSRKGEGTATAIESAWYLVKNEQYRCPTCRGLGNEPKADPEPKKKIIF